MVLRAVDVVLSGFVLLPDLVLPSFVVPGHPVFPGPSRVVQVSLVFPGFAVAEASTRIPYSVMTLL